MQKYLKAAVIGGGIGFAIGATYAVFFVAYRDSLAQKRAEGAPPAGGFEPPVEVQIPEELPARARIAEAMKQRTARAKEIRAQHPDMPWPEALKHAANGTEPEPAVQEADTDVE
ncbi:MAG: hypothetical protein LBV60_22695 [Streptomyces sp.]|nr:hypothetical protein [Streptomyces sp.]